MAKQRVQTPLGRRIVRRCGWLSVVAVVSALGAASGASAAVGTVTEFPLPAAGSTPTGIAAGPDGNVWFTAFNQIGRITPAGVITEYATPTTNSGTAEIAAQSGGDLWFTEENGNRIGRITPSGTITEYAIPTANSEPIGIVAGPDGNLWFTEFNANQIGRITPTGTVTEYALPTANSDPERITVGPDGNLWFTEAQGNRIGRITPAGAVTEYPLPTPGSAPVDIAAQSGGDLWFTEANGDQIGRITPAGTVTEYRVPTAASQPYGIAVSGDGNMWFTEYGANKVGRIVAAGPPAAAITGPPGGGIYTLGQIVATSFSCASGGAALTSCDDSNAVGTTNGGTGQLDTSTAGAHTYTVTATSRDGQSATASISYTVTAPPSASILAPAGGGTYSLGQSVTTSFSCAGGPNAPGLASCDDSNAVPTTSGGTGRLDTATAGPHTYTVTATAQDGQSSSTSISYTVNYTRPSAAILSPANGAVYIAGQRVTSAFSCTDGPGGPGIASCRDANGAPSPHGRLNTGTAGARTYTVTATSADGQTATTHIRYTVLPAPRVSVRTTRAGAAGGRVALSLACRPGSRCRGTVSLTLRERLIRMVGHHRTVKIRTVGLGRAAYSLAAGRSRIVRLTLTRNARRRLTAGGPHRRILAVATATVSGGHPVARVVVLTLVTAAAH